MATLHGSVSEFQPGTDDWNTYAERLGYYFSANGITEEAKKRSILLAVCGTATLKLIKSLAGADLSTKTYTNIVEMVKTYYEPQISEIVQRYKFNTRQREQGETIAAYVAALRELAQHCGYNVTLPEMLRDRLVCGVNHQGIQKKLLGEKDLTYDKAFSLAQSIELAERDAKKLKVSSSISHPQVLYSKNKGGAAPPLPANKPKATEKGTGKTCYRCGGNDHLAPACKHLNTECRYCKKKGHLARVCRTRLAALAGEPKRTPPPKKNLYIEENPPQEDAYDMFTVQDHSTDPMYVQVLINNVPVKMQIDTGASLSIINRTTHQDLQERSTSIAPLEPSTAQLQTYTGQLIPLLGKTRVTARYETTEASLSIQVADGVGPNLAGRDWLNALKIPCGQVNAVEHDPKPLQSVLSKHAEVFDDTLGCMADVKIALQVNESAKPKFHKPRSVPSLLREKVDKELQRMQDRNIISPVKHSQWATPIVPVPKKDGSVRICGDFKTTINQAFPTETYPLPRIDELFADLSGGKLFSKLDLANAFLQLPLSEESKPYLTINTTKGLFQYNRLPYGIASAPAIFQRTIETLLRDIKGVSVYIDDILVTGSTTEEHLKTLNITLERLKKAGLRLNRSKCFFLKPRIAYLGHVIDEHGLHPNDDKVAAIKDAPAPKNLTELRAFLGIVNYYGKFLPSLADKLSPLYMLLCKNRKWVWTSKQESAFQLAKEALQTDAVLVHFDSTKPLILACDASQYGLGAVLSHIMEDGSEKPIAFASRTMNPAERRYSQLEQEGLAIIFGLKKFHNYLYGRRFTIESDHQPLSYIFSETKGIPVMASARIQRWALTLVAYQYNIRYKSGKTLNNADALSRLPRPITCTDDCMPAELNHLILHLPSTAINASKIKDWTSKDPLLSQVMRYLLTGWPDTPLGDEFKPYTKRKNELSVLDGCILWGSRVVIPPQGRTAALQELHETHPGCSKMKGLARCYIWWPKMDAAIEDTVKECHTCQESRPSPPVAPLHPWEWPSQPWSRIHLDFAGPFLGSMFLIVVDAHSKWMDIHPMQTITSEKTIEKLRIIFANHGLPHKVVTDNGTSFTSAEFAEFMSQNGIVHVKSAPYHPSTNGLAERAVQSFKQGIKRIKGATIQERISKFLFTYRITPHTVTGVPPAELLMGRRLRCRLDSWHPDISRRVQDQKQKQAHDSATPPRTFSIGDTVYVKNFTGSDPKWLPGSIVMVTGPVSYQVELESGVIVRRHVDAIKQRHATGDAVDDSGDSIYLPDCPDPPVPTPPTPGVEHSPTTPTPPPSLPSQPRRSTRAHIQTDFWGYS